MKIALLSPRGPLYRHKVGIWKKSMRYAPLTLTTLAALVPKEVEAEIKIYDEGIEEIPENLEADLIGISAITGSSTRAYQLADKFRERGLSVVLGGVHPTLLPEEASKHADSIVIGYAEQSWPRLLRDFKNNSLKRIYIQDKVDLNNMPLPRRDMLNPGNYTTINTLEATRGCVHGCEFCVVKTAWGQKQFHKPVKDVIRDIKSLSGKTVVFLDLDLISDEEYAKELWTAMIPLKIKWGGLTTVRIAWNDELLDLAEKSGCKALLIGFESISKKALLKTSKGFNTTKEHYYTVKRLHEKGIMIMGCFVFGLDGDDKEVFKRTVDFCLDAKIDLPRFAITTPFPNTPLYRRFKSEGRILHEDWSLYDGQHVVFKPKEMTVAELYEGTEWAWKKIYSYSSIYKRLAGARVQTPIALPLNLGYRFYANNLSRFYTCDTISNF